VPERNENLSIVNLHKFCINIKCYLPKPYLFFPVFLAIFDQKALPYRNRALPHWSKLYRKEWENVTLSYKVGQLVENI